MSDVCSICLDNITADKITTPCNHSFHTACFMRWYNTATTCPVCRTDISYRDIGIDCTNQNNIPRPKFRKGQAVRYNAEKRAQFFQYIREHPGARMPTVMLRIWTEPRWDGTTWMYDYEYDWSSEGTAREEDLEPGHIGA